MLVSRPTVPQTAGARRKTKPKTKIARMPGEMNPWPSWMMVKMLLLMAGLPSCGATSTATAANATTATRPTRTVVAWLALGATNFLKTSMAKMVDAAFSMAASELTTAPSRAASTKPTIPMRCGSTWPRSCARAVSYLKAISFTVEVAAPAARASSRTRWS